jgi:hypothetical protein
MWRVVRVLFRMSLAWKHLKGASGFPAVQIVLTDGLVSLRRYIQTAVRIDYAFVVATAYIGRKGGLRVCPQATAQDEKTTTNANKNAGMLADLPENTYVRIPYVPQKSRLKACFSSIFSPAVSSSG